MRTLPARAAAGRRRLLALSVLQPPAAPCAIFLHTRLKAMPPCPPAGSAAAHAVNASPRSTMPPPPQIAPLPRAAPPLAFFRLSPRLCAQRTRSCAPLAAAAPRPPSAWARRHAHRLFSCCPLEVPHSLSQKVIMLSAPPPPPAAAASARWRGSAALLHAAPSADTTTGRHRCRVNTYCQTTSPCLSDAFGCARGRRRQAGVPPCACLPACPCLHFARPWQLKGRCTFGAMNVPAALRTL